MGLALLEQQQAEEMKERVKDYQLHQLAIQHDTDARTERAIQQGNEQPQIQQGGSSSSVVRNVVGVVVGGVGSVARGVAHLLNPFSGGLSSLYDDDGMYHAPGATTPVIQQHASPGATTHAIQQQASPVPIGWDEAMADFENDRLNEWYEKESQMSQKSETSRRSVRDHLDETHEQYSGVVLPLIGGVGSSPATPFGGSYGSIQGSSPAAPTNYIGSPAQTVRSSPAYVQWIVQTPPESVRSSPESVRSSPESVRSSPQVIQSSPESVRRLIDFA